jgi:hypothetical protein
VGSGICLVWIFLRKNRRKHRGFLLNLLSQGNQAEDGKMEDGK